MSKKLSDKEKSEIYKDWSKLINMSASELESWAKNPDRLKASLNRQEAKSEGGIQSGFDSLHRIKRRKKKKKSEWTEEDYKNAKQEIGFNSRMLGNNPGKLVGGTNRSKWEISLLNWGHNPAKANSPANSKYKSWKKKHKSSKKVARLHLATKKRPSNKFKSFVRKNKDFIEEKKRESGLPPGFEGFGFDVDDVEPKITPEQEARSKAISHFQGARYTTISLDSINKSRTLISKADYRLYYFYPNVGSFIYTGDEDPKRMAQLFYKNHKPLRSLSSSDPYLADKPLVVGDSQGKIHVFQPPPKPEKAKKAPSGKREALRKLNGKGRAYFGQKGFTAVSRGGRILVVIKPAKKKFKRLFQEQSGSFDTLEKADKHLDSIIEKLNKFLDD
jgi:hypothetical protein